MLHGLLHAGIGLQIKGSNSKTAYIIIGYEKRIVQDSWALSTIQKFAESMGLELPMVVAKMKKDGTIFVEYSHLACGDKI